MESVAMLTRKYKRMKRQERRASKTRKEKEKEEKDRVNLLKHHLQLQDRDELEMLVHNYKPRVVKVFQAAYPDPIQAKEALVTFCLGESVLRDQLLKTLT